MSTLPNCLTPEQYLEIERKGEYKSEYFNGRMFAMSGARREHNLIAGNAFAELRQRTRSEGCEVYVNDMRVCVNKVGLYTYPDVVVACSDPRFIDGEIDTLLNPTL